MSTTPDPTPSPQDGNDPREPPSGAGDEFKPITTQDDLNAVIADRLKRERDKFKDYKDVKAKADRLDEIEQANKSELEKATEEITTTKAERDSARAEALRLRIAVEHGIGLEDADLFLTGTDEETLRAQAKRLVDREVDRKKKGNRVPGEGTGSPTASTPESALARALFSGD